MALYGLIVLPDVPLRNYSLNLTSHIFHSTDHSFTKRSRPI